MYKGSSQLILFIFFLLNLTEEDTNDRLLFSIGSRNLFFSFKTRKINPVTMNLHINNHFLSVSRKIIANQELDRFLVFITSFPNGIILS